MKLVSICMGEDYNEVVVSEDMIKHGVFFGEQCDLLTNADEEVFNEYLQEKEEDYLLSFMNFLDDKGIKYRSFSSEEFTEYEDIEADTEVYKYYYSYFDDKLLESKDALNFEEVKYIEYWDGHNWRQKEIESETDLEKIESDIGGYEQHRTGQHNLYKDNNGTLYLEYESYYQGCLGTVREIDEEDLKELFDYDI